ncbi:MAG TPA: zinc ABC transporter substrate-binding protein [Thermohalobaculum sp.]|nr:zinc ABC transporter substrate-binding protein [Thermohalobaculum sp.]
MLKESGMVVTQSLKATFMAVALAIALPSLATAEPKAVATVGMLADVAENVAGDCIAVETMMGPGTDPHLYKASAGDVRLLFSADAILYAGNNLEGQLGEVLGKLAERRPTKAVAEVAVPQDRLLAFAGAHYPDPHVWMDVSQWASTAPVIAELFGAMVPECAEAMQARAVAYAAELAALHDWVRASVATIPAEQRILVTAHDAFAYYGRAYGIDVAGIQGISTESEAGIADIRQTVDTVVARNVPAVFIESTINPRTIQAVIAAAAGRGHAVALGSQLYSDAMGEAGTAAGTYIGMIHANTLAIVSALGGTPVALPDGLAAWAAKWNLQ